MLAKFYLGHPETALRYAVVIGGWGIYMLIIAPRAFRIQKLESRNPDNIDKEACFKVLTISYDIRNTNGQILKLRFSNIFFIQRSFET